MSKAHNCRVGLKYPSAPGVHPAQSRAIFVIDELDYAIDDIVWRLKKIELNSLSGADVNDVNGIASRFFPI